MKKQLIKFCKGYSLVEMMVSVTLTFLLSAGLFNIMMNNIQTYRIDRNLASMQQNGQFAINTLNYAIHLAGFRNEPSFNNLQTYQTYNQIYPTGAEAISGTYQSVNNNDTLTVRYQGSSSGNVFDCSGRPVLPNHLATNVFSISVNDELVCDAFIDGDASPNNPNILVDGVQAFHLRFGEDRTNDNVIDRYVSANEIDLQFNRVKSIKVSLLLRSSEAIAPTADVKVHHLQDLSLAAYNDHFYRKVFTSTANIRNFQGV